MTSTNIPVRFHDMPPLNTNPPVGGNDGNAQQILSAATAILAQGRELLRILSSETYTQKVPLVFNASIGGHYRHCLDHFTCLLRGFETDEIDYDHRRRDARVELQLDFALKLTCHIRAQLELVPASALSLPVKARAEVRYGGGGSSLTHSTFGREIVYAIAHAIHHYALISVMARILGARLPDNFGVAPSTVAHQAAGSQ